MYLRPLAVIPAWRSILQSGLGTDLGSANHQIGPTHLDPFDVTKSLCARSDSVDDCLLGVGCLCLNEHGCMDNSLVEQIKQVISGLTAPDGDLFFKCNSAETGGPQRVFCFCDLCKSKRRRSRRQIDVHRAVFVDCCHQQAHHVPAFVRGKPSSVIPVARISDSFFWF